MIWHKKTATTQIQPNFQISEFKCKCNNSTCTCTWHDPLLSDYLQKIRNHFGKAVTITSGYRCPSHNTAIGGATNSYHTRGEAADITVKDTTPAEVAKYAESIGIKGIGLYETNTDGYFVHIDTRTTKSFWYGQAGTYRETFGGSTENNSNSSTEGEEGSMSNNTGMVCEFTTTTLNTTSYTTTGTLGKLYVITCVVNNTTPYHTVTIDRANCASNGSPYLIRIGGTLAAINMTILSDNTVRFATLDMGGDTAYIRSVASYY